GQCPAAARLPPVRSHGADRRRLLHCREPDRRHRRYPAQSAPAEWPMTTNLPLSRPDVLRQLARLWRRAPRSLRIGAVILAIHVLAAVIGAFWPPYDYSRLGTGVPLSGMSWQHPFGVDQLGRDIFSRVLYGGHVVLLLSISGTFLGLVIGAVTGLLSGYIG